MIVPLSRPYVARGGTPEVEFVDQRIFHLTYFHHCMACGFCHDSCCQFGATIEEPKLAALLERADELEEFTGVPREGWFADCWRNDVEYPGGRYTRTQVRETPRGDRCVFTNPDGRGCQLHAFAVHRGLPVHDLKPMSCTMFPVLWDKKTLIVPLEIEDQTLVCIDSGLTLYRSARNDLEYFFSPELVAELDELERKWMARPGMLHLPLAAS
ncbi:MAG: hypothetical protein ACJ8F7_16255 [Gemmataceae bacterium]